MKTWQPSCRVCGFTQFREFTKKNGFHLQRCEHCSLIQVTDDLSNVSVEDIYDKEFFDKEYGWLQKEGRGRQREYEKFHYRMQEIEQFKPQRGVILDVGCSFGFFLDTARSRGWKAVGVEIGEHAASFAQTALGLEVCTSDVAVADLPLKHFDVVTLWNVIEHLNDPLATLRRINAFLKQDGLLVFTTGAEDSYLARIQGSKWRMYIPPIHLANYNLRAVEILLNKTGFALQLRSWAFPRETLLQKLRVIRVLKKLQFSDKMKIFAKKDRAL